MPIVSATADEVHDLHDVIVCEQQRPVRIPLAQYSTVVLDDDELGIDAERFEQGGDSAIPGRLARRSVHRQSDRFSRVHRVHHMLKYSA